MGRRPASSPVSGFNGRILLGAGSCPAELATTTYSVARALQGRGRSESLRFRKSTRLDKAFRYCLGQPHNDHRIIPTMSSDVADKPVRRASAQPRMLQRAIDAVARRLSEDESEGGRVLTASARQIRALQIEQVVADSQATLDILLSGRLLANGFGDRNDKPREAAIAHETRPTDKSQGESESITQSSASRSRHDAPPVITSPGISRLIAPYAGASVGINPSISPPLPGMLFGEARYQDQRQETSYNAGVRDSLGHLGPRYSASLRLESEGQLPAKLTLEREDGSTDAMSGPAHLQHQHDRAETRKFEQVLPAGSERDRGDKPGPPVAGTRVEPNNAAPLSSNEGVAFSKAFADILTAADLRPQTAAIANNRPLLAGTGLDHWQSTEPSSLRIGDQRNDAERLFVSDRPTNPMPIELSDLIGQGDRQANWRSPATNSDQSGGGNASESPAFGGADASVQAQIAAVADDLQRLRAAVRRTIDDLESVRNSVQPTMPALPPNRGTFRIS
jgi:hypothetical protein